MRVTWASVAASPRPPPTPQERWKALISTYASRSSQLALLEALGLLANKYEPRDSPAAALIEHCIVVAVDTEAWTTNTDEMTEIGLVIAEHKAGKDLKGNLGPFAENLLCKMEYHHLRIWENAHLRTNAKWMRGPEGNRFGKSRFVTFPEANAILDEVFNQPIVSSDPSLAGLKRPVVLIGHAVKHDTANMAKHGLKYDFAQHGTVVKEIDTQRLTKEIGAWVDKSNSNNDIGLDKLCEDVFGFAHDDAHTALNDAARTVICAVNLALGTWKKKGKAGKTMQEVARYVEEHSQLTFASNWGTEHCCTRCGSRQHSNSKQECEAPVYCEACTRFDEPKDEDHICSHLEQFCVHVAHFKGWRRRVVDASRKHNALPSGPPIGSHPPSSWKGKWPMDSPSDVLLPEIPKMCQAGRTPRVPLATSMPLPGVKTTTFQSTGRELAERACRIPKKTQRSAIESVAIMNHAPERDAWQADDAWNGTFRK